MNNLYVYGCSFTKLFDLMPTGLETSNQDFTRNFHGVDFWVHILKMNLTFEI